MSLRQREHNVLQAVPGEAEKANFILASGAQPPELKPTIRESGKSGDRATLILTVAALGQGEIHMSSTGAGIEDQHTFQSHHHPSSILHPAVKLP